MGKRSHGGSVPKSGGMPGVSSGGSTTAPKPPLGERSPKDPGEKIYQETVRKVTEKEKYKKSGA